LQTVNEFGHICSLVIQNSCIPFIAFYPDGRIMTCNPAFHYLTNYSGKELEGLGRDLYGHAVSRVLIL
jgi:PAS domain-containing protein